MTETPEHRRGDEFEDRPEAERQVHDEFATRRRQGWIFAVLALILLIMVIGLWWAISTAAAARATAVETQAIAQENAAKTRENAQARDEAVAAVKESIAQFERCRTQPATAEGCTEPVVDPDELAEPVDPEPVPDVEPVIGEQGEPGRAPTPSEVYAAVARWCGEGRCDGADGTDGEDGRDAPPVSGADVAAAVAAYCEGGSCRGASGDPGADGEDGQDSTVPGPQGEAGQDSTVPGPQGAVGPQGPGPTAEQIAQAVAAYCADNACRGEKGDKGDPGDPGSDGTDGTDGEDGRGVVSINLEGDITECAFVVTYTNGDTVRIPTRGLVCP